jgi:hypothetical protein
MTTRLEPAPLFDVFQPGLRRGSASLPYDPEKEYAFVEHPVEGWRVYLRSAVFLHEDDVPFDALRFLVFKHFGARQNAHAWEPPKGQMEGKDIRRKRRGRIRPLIDILEENARRETEEEAHITDIKRLVHTGLVFQSSEEDFIENTYFQYHIFQGFVTNAVINNTFAYFDWMKENPAEVAKFSRDKRETDKVSWYSPTKTKLNRRWCPEILAAYLNEYGKKIDTPLVYIPSNNK